MKKILTVLLSLAMLISMATVTFAATPEEIKYDFESEDELKDWQAFGGSWKVEEGCLKQTSGTPGSWNMHLALKDVTVKDFTLRMRIRVTKESLGTGWAALYFRKLNLGDNQEQSGYGLTMEGKSSKGKTVVVDWAHSSKVFEDECRSNPGDWNDIVLSVSGNTIKVYFNEDIAAKTPTMTIVDKDNGWKEAGYMSLAAGNAKIDVDYFYLYSGSAQDKAFTGATVAPTDPTPTDAADPTDPTKTPDDPTDPTEDSTDPTETPTDPAEGPAGPTEAPTDPTEAPTDSTEPQDTQQPTQSSEQPDNEQPTVSATETPDADNEPADQDNDGNKSNLLPIVLGVIGAMGIVVVILIYVLGKKKTGK